LNSEFQAFLDAVDAAYDKRMVSQATKSFATSIGYERFAYLQTQGFDIKTINTYPDAWTATYLEQRFSTIDPVVIEAKRRKKPFSWSADGWSARGSSELRRFRKDAISHGIRSGMTIPVRGSFGSTIMLTFASSNASGPESICVNPEVAIQAALAIHYRLRILSAGHVVPPSRVFSSKEAICVTWAAKGKKAHEIASIVGISERTVQHYLDSARQKLGAETVQHLTALATARGMIEF
jgi:LuxR family transcriptional activator of conjugal transfer of Ti plasmids